MNPSHCKWPCLQSPAAIAFACGGTQIGALLGTRKVNIGGGEELLTGTLCPYSEMGEFTRWCHPSLSHIIISEIHRRGDFPKNVKKMSEKFTCVFCMSTAYLLDHPAYPEVEGLDL